MEVIRVLVRQEQCAIGATIHGLVEDASPSLSRIEGSRRGMMESQPQPEDQSGPSEQILPLDQLWGALASDPRTGVALVDPGGRIRYLNDSAARMLFGCDADEAVGCTLEELHGAQLAEEFDRALPILRDNGSILFRDLWHGRQLVSAAHLVVQADGEHVLLFVRHVVGEPQPTGIKTPLLYSRYVHLGPLHALTPRELEVLCLVGQGLATKEIARLLQCSPRTIDVHRGSIGRKLGETNPVILAQLAQEAGLVMSDAKRTRLE